MKKGLRIEIPVKLICPQDKIIDGEDLQKWPINSLISYKNTTGELKQGGLLCNSTEDYFIYQCLKTKTKKRVRFCYVEEMYIKLNLQKIKYYLSPLCDRRICEANRAFRIYPEDEKKIPDNLKNIYEKFRDYYDVWNVYHDKVIEAYSKSFNIIREMLLIPCCMKYFFWGIRRISGPGVSVPDIICRFVKRQPQTYMILNQDNRQLLIKLISELQKYNMIFFEAVCDESPKRKQLDNYLESVIPKRDNFEKTEAREYGNCVFFLSNSANPDFFALLQDERYNLYRSIPFDFNNSNGETKVNCFLKKLQQEYLKQDIHLFFLREQSFPFCQYMRELRMDFLCFLITSDKMISFVIEIDGSQHYENVDSKTHVRDVLKQYYLEQLNIHLLRISGQIELVIITDFINQISNTDKVLVINKIKPVLEVLFFEQQYNRKINGFEYFHNFVEQFNRH